MKPLRDALFLLLTILVLVSVRVGPAPAVTADAKGLSPAFASPAALEASEVVPAVTPRKGCKSAPEADRPDSKDLEVARKCADPRPASRT